MTVIRINVDTARAVAVNALNKAAQIGVTIGSFKAQEAIYKVAMSDPVQAQRYAAILTDPRGRLANTVNYSPYIGKSEPVCNDIILAVGTNVMTFYDAKVNVVKNKVIHSQSLVGVSGSIKELIQEGDYNIDISGNIITDNQYGFPVDGLKTLNDILTPNEPINVTSVYLNDIFGVTKIVFTRGSFDQRQIKHFNIMPFTLSFMSDIDHSFLVEDKF